MIVRVWGARGSLSAPGPATVGYGGNTSCVEISLDDGKTWEVNWVTDQTRVE